MVRFRPVLCLSISLFDAVDVLSVRPVRLAESGPKRRPNIFTRSAGAAWSSFRIGRLSVGAGVLLPRLPAHGRRSRLVCLLVALDGAPILAMWAVVVSVGAVGPQHGR